MPPLPPPRPHRQWPTDSLNRRTRWSPTVRDKLKDPALRKGAAADDLAALEAFYGERSEPPIWITAMGFSAQSSGPHRRDPKGRRLGPPARGLRPAARVRPAGNHRGPGPRRDQTHARRAEICALRPRRARRAGAHQRSVRSEARSRDPKAVLTELAVSASPGVYLDLAASQAPAVRGPAPSADQGRRREQGATGASPAATGPSSGSSSIWSAGAGCPPTSAPITCGTIFRPSPLGS